MHSQGMLQSNFNLALFTWNLNLSLLTELSKGVTEQSFPDEQPLEEPVSQSSPRKRWEDGPRCGKGRTEQPFLLANCVCSSRPCRAPCLQESAFSDQTVGRWAFQQHPLKVKAKGAHSVGVPSLILYPSLAQKFTLLGYRTRPRRYLKFTASNAVPSCHGKFLPMGISCRCTSTTQC